MGCPPPASAPCPPRGPWPVPTHGWGSCGQGSGAEVPPCSPRVGCLEGHIPPPRPSCLLFPALTSVPSTLGDPQGWSRLQGRWSDRPCRRPQEDKPPFPQRWPGPGELAVPCLRSWAGWGPQQPQAGGWVVWVSLRLLLLGSSSRGRQPHPCQPWAPRWRQHVPEGPPDPPGGRDMTRSGLPTELSPDTPRPVGATRPSLHLEQR